MNSGRIAGWKTCRPTTMQIACEVGNFYKPPVLLMGKVHNRRMQRNWLHGRRDDYSRAQLFLIDGARVICVIWLPH